MRLALVLMLSAGMALAHAGVKNPAVMERMHGMKSMKDALKAMGEAANGVRAYNQAEIDAALGVLQSEAARIPMLFEAQEEDPKSEALPVIWSQFDAFSDKAAAMKASVGMTVTQEALPQVLGQIAETCKGCHQVYRK